MEEDLRRLTSCVHSLGTLCFLKAQLGLGFPTSRRGLDIPWNPLISKRQRSIPLKKMASLDVTLCRYALLWSSNSALTSKPPKISRVGSPASDIPRRYSAQMVSNDKTACLSFTSFLAPGKGLVCHRVSSLLQMGPPRMLGHTQRCLHMHRGSSVYALMHTEGPEDRKFEKGSISGVMHVQLFGAGSRLVPRKTFAATKSPRQIILPPSASCLNQARSFLKRTLLNGS